MKLKTVFFLIGFCRCILGYCQDTTNHPSGFLKKEVAKFDNFYLDVRKTSDIRKQKVEIIQKQTSDTAVKKPSTMMKLERLDIVVDPNRETPIPRVTVTHLIKDNQENVALGRRVVNGPSQFDSRIELLQLDPKSGWQSKILKNSTSVALVVERSQLHLISDSVYQLDVSGVLGDKYHLCAGEAFFSQPVAGLGTAFMVGDQTMMTAGHVFLSALSKYAIIFDFQLINKIGAYNDIIPVNHVYFPRTTIATIDNLDITIFKVDRPTGRPWLKISKSISVPVNTDIYMIGHPYGLPMKVAANASVQKDEGSVFFTTLDAFQGNSGSPVFRLDTHEVIGILVSGETDYRWNGSCNISTLCTIPYCDGEKAVNISAVNNFSGGLLTSQ
jgi:hypothetical protein